MFKKMVCVIILLLMGISLFSCFAPAAGGASRLSPFKTELTAEDHIAKIIERTEEKYAEQIADGRIKSYTVEILWSFDENPEYFLIDFDGYSYVHNDWPNETILVENAYIVGYIENDKYYMYYYYPKFEKSPFKKQNLENEKKYYGYTVMAVKKDKELLCINGTVDDKYAPGTFLSKSDRKFLATRDYRMPERKY